MQIYEEHQHTDDTKIIRGIFHSSHSKLYDSGHIDYGTGLVLINSIEHINRAFDNDTVEFKFEDITEDYGIITNIVKRKRNLKNIVGILHVNSNYVIGVTKKGIKIYEFTPLDTSLPKFYVSSKTRDNTNKYVIIDFIDWNSNSKFPRGGLVKELGKVGELHTEYEALLYKHELYFKDINKLDFDIPNELIFDDIDVVDFRCKTIFSIDPIGCLDIDDAIHLEELDDIFEVGVHIADVSRYIPENSKLDLTIRERLTSIYAKHKQINMLPDVLATDKCSLLPNKDRYTISVIFKINKKDHSINSYQIFKGKIRSIRAFTYDEAQYLINDTTNGSSIATSLRSLQTIFTGDTHKIIEKIMILTNKTIANELYLFFGDLAIIRHHDGVDMLKYNSVFKNIPENVDENIKKRVELHCMNSAKYGIVKNVNCKRHEGINADIYTHFTSPIRRYIDIVVHRMVKKIINNYNVTEDNTELCIKLNNIMKKTKRMDREMKYISVIDEMEMEYELNGEINTEAYIVNLTTNTITFYIPKYDIEKKIKYIPPKLRCQFRISINDLSVSFTNLHTEQQTTYKMLEKYDIIIVPCIKEEDINKKILIKFENDSFI